MDQPANAGSFDHVDWCRSANIYEVNLRQYTPEGTFAAFEHHLPRLRAMGVHILWLMPIQPIGKKERKGTLGSYYSVADYVSVNPEFGTLADFKRLVAAIHAAGMRVIIDWVANHTAWDHAWVALHPDWYQQNAAGEIGSCEYFNGRETESWTDVLGLDYRQAALWPAMTEALLYWVRECDIDGYRCDVASLVPTPFWEQARDALEAVKPVFMLAEASDPALHRKAFDMTYDWELLDALLASIQGKGAPTLLLQGWLERRQAHYPADALRMSFTSNHDKNSWEGHDVERFGPAFQVCAVLAATLPGMPLIYGGQEAVLDRRLAFFEKDAIAWKGCELAPFYAGLLKLKHEHPALWNGAAGGDTEVLASGSEAVFAFRRRRGDDSVTVLANLSAQAQTARVEGQAKALAPWSWHIEASTPRG
ncbi:Alpha-amylase [Rubrivivax sp. A210]|uniref:alpha-amylase family glycosyl hydrolase n=1 Tax=Rubrivivax sp. A210 TaxID=2772301 RepID=UPI0019182D7A|nr:alpha-amylase family glycosyl hydrolase [Rubrivivax sp. A210]CAD5366254.1 Alpha-amylase [Rubrivivax sp. A210]